LGTFFHYPSKLIDGVQEFNLIARSDARRGFSYFGNERAAEKLRCALLWRTRHSLRASCSDTLVQHAAVPTTVDYLTLPQAILHGGACSLTAPVSRVDMMIHCDR